MLTLLRSRCPIRVFKFDHLVPTEIKMVVTEADPERRLVREINAEPAAREYARLVGKDPDQLSPFIFAAHPVVVPRRRPAPRARDPEGRGERRPDLLLGDRRGPGADARRGDRHRRSTSSGALAELARERPPEAIIGCDCILRRLEVEQMQGLREMSRILSRATTSSASRPTASSSTRCT